MDVNVHMLALTRVELNAVSGAVGDIEFALAGQNSDSMGGEVHGGRLVASFVCPTTGPQTISLTTLAMFTTGQRDSRREEDCDREWKAMRVTGVGSLCIRMHLNLTLR